MKEVLPLAHTKPDWEIFNKTVLECLGKEPTRVLDANHMSPKDFSSFVAVLDLDNDNPLQNLRDGYWTNRTWDHVSLSFLYTLDSDCIVEICSTSDLRILSYPIRKSNFSIITGTLADWYLACVRLCTKKSSDDTKDFMTQCFYWLEQLGYKEIFNGFDRILDNDDNLILRRL